MPLVSLAGLGAVELAAALIRSLNNADPYSIKTRLMISGDLLNSGTPGTATPSPQQIMSRSRLNISTALYLFDDYVRYRLPGDTPDVETVLAPGELIESVSVADTPAARNSHYLKVRDRASFEFALVSVAVALETSGGAVRDVRVAAGGVGARPWRLPEVEAALRNATLSDGALREASARAGVGARTTEQNTFKLTLLRRTVLRALQTVSV